MGIVYKILLATCSNGAHLPMGTKKYTIPTRCCGTWAHIGMGITYKNIAYGCDHSFIHSFILLD